MVLPQAHGEHPDGDPFAAIDAARLQNSALGRLEAAALEEQRVREQAQGSGAGARPVVIPPPRGRQSTSSLAGSAKKAPVPIRSGEVVVLDSSDEDSDEAVAAVKERTVSRGGSASKAKSNGNGNGGGHVVPSSDRKPPFVPDVDIVMHDANSPSVPVAGPSGPSSSKPTPAPAQSVHSLRDRSASPLSSIPNSRGTSPADAGTSNPPAVPSPLARANANGSTNPAAISPAATVAPASTSATVPALIPAAPARAPRQRSPSPAPPPKPKAPPKTIRLTLVLPAATKATEVPEYSVAELAVEAGYVSEEEEEEEGGEGAKGSGSGSGSGSEGESGTEGEGSPRKKQRGNETEKEGEEVGEKEKEPELLGKEDKMEGVESTANGAEKTNAGPEVLPAEPVKKRRKRSAPKILGRLGGYDVDDPFVDDSDLDLYEPQWYHRPKREGYFVCTGQLELISDSKEAARGRTLGSKNKPKFDEDGKLIPATRKPKAAAASTSTTNPIASTSKAKIPTSANASITVAGKPRKSAPLPGVIVIDDDEPPRVSSVPAFGSGAVPTQVKKKTKIKGTFSPELQVELDMLRAEVAKESFEVKNRLPVRLRPLIAGVAWRALELGEYDDDFFAVLPKIFPYNHFTMKKLAKREIFPRRMALLGQTQDEHFATLKQGVAETCDKQRAEWEKAKADWDAGVEDRAEKAAQRRRTMEEESLRQDRELATPEPGNGGGKDGDAVMTSPATTPAGVVAPSSAQKNAGTIASEDVQMAGSPQPGDPAAGTGEEQDVPEPKWKFKFTEAMRVALYHIYTIEDEMSELVIEKQALEKPKDGASKEKAHSILAARKALYARIAALWPDGYMLTNQLSREVSIAKKKFEKTLQEAA